MRKIFNSNVVYNETIQFVMLKKFPSIISCGTTFHSECTLGSERQFQHWAELQIRGGIGDNSKIIFLVSQQKFFLFLNKNTCCDPSLERSQ